MRAFVAEIRRILTEHEGLNQDFNAAVFNEFADSSLNVLIVAFSNSNDWMETMDAQESLMLGIMDVVEKQGLEMAFPTRTVHVVNDK